MYNKSYNIKHSFEKQLFFLGSILILVQFSNIFLYENLSYKTFVLSFYLVLISFIPFIANTNFKKVKLKYQNFILVILAVFFLVATKYGYFHRTYVGFVIVSLMIFTKNIKILIIILIATFFNDNKISFIAGFIYIILLYIERLKNISFIFKLFLLFLSLYLFSYMIFIKFGHWFEYLEVGNYERIHAINYRLTNYITIYELAKQDIIFILFPFDYRVITSTAMDSGLLVALFRSGFLLLIFSLYYFSKNIIMIFSKKELVIFLLPLLTQSAYLNLYVLFILIVFLYIFHNNKKENKCL